MLAASYSLTYEGMTFSDHQSKIIYHFIESITCIIEPMIAIVPFNHSLCLYEIIIYFIGMNSVQRTLMGFVGGIIFILVTKRLLDRCDDFKVANMDRIDAEKMILILFVMTLHSITEGIGVGVSFGGKSGMHLGQFISLSLAVHNVPEGLAVALVLREKKVSTLRTGMKCIFVPKYD